ncbi:histone H1/5, partial [Haematococcus lacustris]
MIVESISALKERTGSSLPAIKKWIQTKYAKDLPGNWEKILSVQLKRMADTGALVRVKASFKLAKPAAAKPKPAATKPKATAKPAAAKPKVPKAAQPAKPVGVKKVKAAPKAAKKAAAPKVPKA